jgi:hypothetical protein
MGTQASPPPPPRMAGDWRTDLQVGQVKRIIANGCVFPEALSSSVKRLMEPIAAMWTAESGLEPFVTAAGTHDQGTDWPRC